MNQVRPDLKNMQFIRLIDQIHLDHSNLKTKKSDITSIFGNGQDLILYLLFELNYQKKESFKVLRNSYNNKFL